jgi:hypothetical protein
LKTDVKVPGYLQKVIKVKWKNYLSLVGILKAPEEKSRIRRGGTKILQIHNIAVNTGFFRQLK